MDGPSGCRFKNFKLLPGSPEWIKKHTDKPDWIAKARERLKSLSWLMKLLKEPLARLANREDECEGAFFASRFKSIGILDEPASFEICAYVDLNPLAAGITFPPEQSPHTSVTERIEHAWPHVTRADFEAALRGLVVENLPLGAAEQTHWLCPLEDRCAQGGSREGMLPDCRCRSTCYYWTTQRALFPKAKRTSAPTWLRS